MRSIELVAPRVLEPREMPAPRDPGPGEVLVRVRAVGVCGSDIHWYYDGRIGRKILTYPQILGHEAAGEVVAAGPGAGFETGCRVAIEPAVTCGACEPCRSGRQNLCRNGSFMGSTPTPGLFREYALVPAANLIRVPEALDWDAATVIEPLAVILHVLDMAPVRIGDTVAVSGAGPIGLLIIAAARAAGAGRIFAADLSPARVELARRMGADVAVNAREASLAEAVLDQTRGRGADTVYEAAGDNASINQALRAAGIGGTVALIGLSGRVEQAFDTDAAMARELRVQAIRRSNHNAHAAAAMLAAGRIPGGLVTHRYGLEEVPRVFENLTSGDPASGKIVIGIP
jgi:L-iditol 2-dehydrogenase